MQLFKARMTRREALRLSGLSFPTFLLPARAADSQFTAILTRPIPRTGEALPVVANFISRIAQVIR